MKGLVFTYLVTSGGVAGALVNPFYGLLAYVVLAIVKPEAMWPWAVTSGRYSMAVALAMMIGWSYSKRATFQSGSGGTVLGVLLAFFAWAGFGAFFAPNQDAAWLFIETFTKIIIPIFIGLTTIDSVSKLKQLAWCIAGTQGYVAFEMNLSYFQGYNTLATEGFGALDNNSAAIALVTALGLTFFLGLHAESLFAKGLAFGMAALMGHAVLFSYSRGGMMAMLVSGAAAFVMIPKRPRHYFAFALAAFMGFSLAGVEVRERFASSFASKKGEREASAQSRIDLWRDCRDVMDKHPIMGCGPNQWPVIAPKYGWPAGKEAHSLWMQTGAELGFPGLILLAGFYLLCIVRCWMLTWKRTVVSDPWLIVTARMVVVSLAGFAVAAQFVSLEALEIPYYVALLGCGALRLHSVGNPNVQIPMSNEYPIPNGQDVGQWVGVASAAV